MPEQISVIYATFESLTEAKRVGEDLVQRHFAGCVNILPQMISIYQWQNEFHNSAEVVLLAKTSKNRVGDVMAEIKRLHNEQTPAIFEIPAGAVDSDYSRFISQSVAG